jgi:hypothetical protein
MAELDRATTFEGKRTTVGDALRAMWKRAKTTDAYDANTDWLDAYYQTLPIGRRLQLWAELHLLKASDKASMAAGYLNGVGLPKGLVKSPVIAAWVKKTLPLLDDGRLLPELLETVFLAAARNKITIPARLTPLVESLSSKAMASVCAVCEVRPRVPRDDDDDDDDDDEYAGVEPVPLTVLSVAKVTSATPLQKKQLARAQKDAGGTIDDAEYFAIGDAKGKHVYDAYFYFGDTGKVFVVGTTRVVATLIQLEIDQCNDLALALGLQNAYADSRRKKPANKPTAKKPAKKR